MRFSKQDDAGPFERPLLLRTPLYLVMTEIAPHHRDICGVYAVP